MRHPLPNFRLASNPIMLSHPLTFRLDQHRHPAKSRSSDHTDAMTSRPSKTAGTEQGLQRLRRQYLALYPVRHVNFDLSNGADSDAEPLYRHQEWIYEHMLSWTYQPAKDYQRKFLKGLIDTVEDGLRTEEAVQEEWVSLILNAARSYCGL